MAVHTRDELRQMQAMPLSIKIKMTEQRIRDWVYEYGEDGVYVSFSGGKDSTVLADIVRNRLGFVGVPLVFCDTGLEYPEIREFVRGFDNVVWLKPSLTFKQVIEKYGYPMINKEVAGKVSDYRSAVLRGKDSYVRRQMEGTYVSKNGKKNMYNVQKYRYLLEAPFPISKTCCRVMKKEPAKEYEKETGRKPMLGTMAEESILRTQKWLQEGCNAFEAARPHSNPMSFWTEQDVLQYIKQNNVQICSVYGDVVFDVDGGQMTLGDLGYIPGAYRLKTTGCERTGCMFCGFGCHKRGDDRFVRMKETHPKQYEWIMKPWSEGGLGYKEVIDWLNEHGDVHIEY